MRQVLLALLAISSLSAEIDRTYLGVNLSTEIVDDWEVSIAPEWRYDRTTETALYQTDFTVTHKLPGPFKVGIGYRIGEIENDGDWSQFDRWNIDAKYNYKWKRLTTQLRLRYTSGQDEEDEHKEFVRYRLKTAYDLKDLNLKPFISYEYFDSTESDASPNRHAFSGGLTYEHSKHHELSVEFRRVEKHSSNKDYSVFLSSYSFKF